MSLSETELTSRLMLLGLAKQAYAAGTEADSTAIPERLRSRYQRAVAAWGESREESPLRQARRDAQAVAHLSALQGMARLGMVTIARLLQELEPYRFRWVLAAPAVRSGAPGARGRDRLCQPGPGPGDQAVRSSGLGSRQWSRRRRDWWEGERAVSAETAGFTNEGATMADPLGSLPTITGREARLAQAIRSAAWQGPITQGLGWLAEFLGDALEVGEVGYLETLSGLKRPGVIAQVRSPSHQVTLGLHLETTLAHALVDRLLGYERADGEQRLQVTPVEWGILTFALARCLNEVEGPSSLSDLILERVGPESFRPEASLSYLTLLWPVRLGEVRSEVRAWVTESFLLAAARKTVAITSSSPDFTRFSGLGTRWCAVGGLATLPRGLSMLRVGGGGADRWVSPDGHRGQPCGPGHARPEKSDRPAPDPLPPCTSVRGRAADR